MTLLLLGLQSCTPPTPPIVVPPVVDVPGTGDPALLCQIDLTCEGNILDDPKAPCALSITSGDDVLLYDGKAGVELRGRTSLALPKPQYSVDLRTHSELPVWPGFTWRYLDDGAGPDVDWRESGYDDSSWQQGAAPLGYGEDNLSTVLTDAGTTTTYFRYAFTVASRASITRLTLGVLRNDGVAVYLNGTEVLRDNLAADATYDTLAQSAVTAADEVLWVEADVEPGLLVDGPNVLAVELHQWETGPGDTGESEDTAAPEAARARFDLYLEGAGGDAATDLFGMGSDSDWIFNGQYLDRVLFRNRLAYDLFQSWGGAERYATESVFCELTLSGQFQGVYTLGERIEREDTRVDIGNDGTEGSSFIVKLDDVDGFHDNAVGYGTWQLVYPDSSPEAEAEVSATLESWEQAVLTGGDVFAHIDMDSAVDFVLLQELAKNIDAYQLSVYLWKDTTGKMYFAPWDLDLSFGYPYYDCGAEGWVTRAPYVDAMVADPAFHAALVARWAELRDGSLAEAAILARIDAYDQTLGPAVARNFARWPFEDIVYATDFVDDWLCPVDSYEDEHARVLAFISARLAWMDANIVSF